jgi:hypothetical protein
MNDNLQAEIVVSYIFQYLIEAAKRSSWMPWLSTETGNLNRIVAAILASAYAAGMTFTLTHLGPGDWNLHATGITWLNVSHFLGHALRVYAMQKGWFKILTMPGAQPAIGEKGQ